MTTKDEALKMALEALTCIDDDGYDPGHRCGQCDDYVDRNGHVRAAIRAALAQKDEAVVTTTTIEALEQEIYENTRLFVPTAVMQWMLSKYHTTQPKRQPLTDVQISYIWDRHIAPVFEKNGINPVVFARAIEKAHGIGVDHDAP